VCVNETDLCLNGTASCIVDNGLDPDSFCEGMRTGLGRQEDEDLRETRREMADVSSGCGPGEVFCNGICTSGREICSDEEDDHDLCFSDGHISKRVYCSMFSFKVGEQVAARGLMNMELEWLGGVAYGNSNASCSECG